MTDEAQVAAVAAHRRAWPYLGWSRTVGLSLLMLLAVCALIGPDLVGQDPVDQVAQRVGVGEIAIVHPQPPGERFVGQQAIDTARVGSR